MNGFTTTMPLIIKARAPRTSVDAAGLRTQPAETAVADSEARRLAAGVARGDEAIFREFYDLFQPRLFRLALVLGRGDESIAHDVVQGTFVIAARKLRSVAGADHLWHWLARVARQQIAKTWRQLHRDSAVIGVASLPDQVDGTDPDLVLEEILDAAMLAMTPEERELVEWFYFDHLSHKEIAGRLKATPKSVSSRLERSRAKLRLAIAQRLAHETGKAKFNR
jgi:RNA polymerase sigma-70 factor (ECF subfamily)